MKWVLKALLFVGAQALHLVDVMEDEGVAPDMVTWGTLMAAAKYLGQAEAADMVRQLCKLHAHATCAAYTKHAQPIAGSL